MEIAEFYIEFLNIFFVRKLIFFIFWQLWLNTVCGRGEKYYTDFFSHRGIVDNVRFYENFCPSSHNEIQTLESLMNLMLYHHVIPLEINWGWDCLYQRKGNWKEKINGFETVRQAQFFEILFLTLGGVWKFYPLHLIQKG